MEKEKEDEKNLKEEILKQLLKDHPIHEMVNFSELDIQEKLKENTFMVVKYREFYYKELSISDELEIKYDKLCGLKYKYYRFEDDKEWTKVEIEKYCLPSDKKVTQMRHIMDRQNVRVRFFHNCYTAFEKQQWNMKNFSENLRGGF